MSARPAPTRTYSVGDTLTYRSYGELRQGVITGKYADVKNGEPGFDMDLPSGVSVWGYDSQIVSIP